MSGWRLNFWQSVRSERAVTCPKGRAIARVLTAFRAPFCSFGAEPPRWTYNIATVAGEGGASLRSVFDPLQLQRDLQSCGHIHHVSAMGCLIELRSDIPPSRLIPCLRGQVAIEQHTHLGECGEMYDSRNDERSRQWSRPIRTSHIGPMTLFYFLVTSISRETFRGMIQINLVGYRDLTI